MSPSTHQDSEKVRFVCTFCDALVSPYPEPDRCPHCRQREPLQQHIPIPALLSDEVVEAVARRLKDWENIEAPTPEDEARIYLQAAIEQVGGGQGG